MAVPQFTSGSYEYGSVVKDTCDVTGNTTLCDQTSSGLSVYVCVFILGQILFGIGATSVYSLGIVFIDSNVPAKDSPVYQSMVNLGEVFGPAVGYFAGSYLLSFYVDFYMNADTGYQLSPEDPRWVGAWWLGYVIALVLGLTAALGIAAYPRKLPNRQTTHEYNLSQMPKSTTSESSADMQQIKTPRNILGIMKATFCNPTVMLVCATMTFQDMTVSGVSPFFSKYVQNTFNVTSSWAALVAGITLVIGAVSGMLAGGVIVRALRLKIKGMLVLVLIACLIAPVVNLGFIFAKCDLPSLAGLTVNYENSSSSGLAGFCNAECGCTSTYYKPVCGADNLQYFSPCHAGCQDFTAINDKQYYFNCSCVTLPSNHSLVTPSATEGSCETGCSAMPVFLVFATFTFFLTFVEHIPTQNIILRAVPETHRAIVLGIQIAFTEIVGSVVAPVIYGAVLDSACLQWQDKCGERGSCWIYDTTQVAVRTYIFVSALKLGSIIVIVLALCTLRPSPNDEKENKGN